MERVIIGEGCYSINRVMKEIKKNRSSFALLIQNYATFGNSLDIDAAKMVSFERKLNLGAVELEEIPREMLKVWKAARGKEAKLQSLNDALIECGIQDIADTLRNKFCPDIELDRLMRFQIVERSYTLEELLGQTASKATYKKVFSHLKNADQPINLFQKEVCIPEQPPYYIPRAVIQRTELEKSIFSAEATKEHVFLMRDTTKIDLATTTGYQAIDTTGNQLDEITVRFMLLEHEDDFDTIRKNTNHPVHLIHHKNQSYFWVKSSKSLHSLYNFLKAEGTELPEKDFVQRIAEMAPPSAFCISDSPGMGKTLLLGNLARQIRAYNTSPFSIFIVLQQFAQQIGQHISSASEAIEAIAKFVCENNEGLQLVAKQMLQNEDHNFDIYFDGYDEIPREMLKNIDRFLRHTRVLKNVRIFVTTRPHLKSRIENQLKLLSFEILPFDKSSQVNFLIKYWCQQDKTLESECDPQLLETFATNCLEKLHKNMTEDEREIAGIPLQCMILAEVYMRDATRFSKLKGCPMPVIQVSSFFEAYKGLLETKFGKIREDRGTYILAHVNEALKLLFPDWVQKFLTVSNGLGNIDVHKLHSIGIIESSSSKSRRFVHRTFAEYLLAEYLVKYVNTYEMCADLMLTVILAGKGVKVIEFSKRPNLYKMEYPVIAYFIDRHLQNQILTLNCVNLHRLTLLQNIGVAVAAACSHGFGNIFNFLWNSLGHSGKKCDVQSHFRHLPHLAAESSKNDSLVKYVTEATINTLEARFSDLTFTPTLKNNPRNECLDIYELPWIPNCTPVHVAIYHGNYNLVVHFLQRYKEEIVGLKYLLHLCARDSVYNSESKIQDKILIIQVISEFQSKGNADWVEEQSECTECPPLLQSNVHQKILEQLVKSGADVNAYSNIYGTILHRISTPNAFLDLLQWAKSRAFNKINHRNSEGFTPLMLAIARFGALDTKILKFFKEEGLDFNSVNCYDYPLLFYALITGDLDFIDHIINCGVNLNFMVTNSYITVANVVVASAKKFKWDDEKVLSLFSLLFLKGFNQISVNIEPNPKLHKEVHPEHQELSLEEIRQTKIDFIPNCTDLHVAANSGSFKLFEALVEQVGYEKVRNTKYVVHACVRDSARDNELVISNKILIIKKLAELSNDCLREELDGLEPIFQNNVHLKVLHSLLELGAKLPENLGNNLRVRQKSSLIQWAKKYVPYSQTTIHFNIERVKVLDWIVRVWNEVEDGSLSKLLESSI